MSILDFIINTEDGRWLAYAVFFLMITGFACLVERHYNIDYYEDEKRDNNG